jgi:hypothetical protein
MRLLRRWNSENRAARIQLNLTPVQQHEDETIAYSQGSPPTIDFCFRGWDKSDGYFGAECKILNENDDILIKRYVNTGVKHFISGRYGSGSTISAMIGYVLSGKIPDIVNELKKEICATYPRLNLSRDIACKDAQYKSQHIRSLDRLVIVLYHLFFDFATIERESISNTAEG